MSETPDETHELWNSVLTQLNGDDRVTPQLQGFLNLVEPKGVLAGTLYLEVPNELTRGMLEQRIRVPLLNALAQLDDEPELTNFAIVVNPEIRPTQMLGDVDTITETEFDESTGPTPPLAPITDINRRSDSRLNPKYNFDNFVIGGSNRSSSMATRVSARPTSCTP